MASPFRDKIQVFFFGLMLGLLIGACFFVFKLDGYFKELSFYKSNAKKGIVKEVMLSPVNEKPAEKRNYKSVSKAPAKTATVADSVDVENVQETALVSNNQNDSLLNDSAGIYNEENIVVKKDELISARTVDMQVIKGTKDIVPGNSDSLLNKISGVKKETPVTSYKVEFWMSPLNYKGYKMLKNKIILYGINPAEPVKFYKLDGVVYCRTSSLLYKLDYSPEFRYFEVVTDESLITKIK